jgi:formylmethanofuran dehydrogenase subunit E
MILLLGATLAFAEDRLPQPQYQRQSSAGPAWLATVVQFHGHLGPAVVAGARMGMIGLRAVEAKGYFDVHVTCEGPLAKPPQSCFLDGIQVATGATLGKRNLQWVQADQLTVRVKNIRTGKAVVLHPTPSLMELLASFKPQSKMAAEHKIDDEQLAVIARKIAVMPEQEVTSVTMADAPAPTEQPLARYTYLERDGIYVYYQPHDVAKYRQLLPKMFDMPEAPLVQVFVADFYKMDPATQPYLEAAVFLLAKYEGKEAWHCISMPVTSDEARRLGVRNLGYPKVMGEVTLRRSDPDYTGNLQFDGKPVMTVRLKTGGHTLTEPEHQWFQRLTGIPSLNILDGKVLDPLAGHPKPTASVLDLSRRYPGKMTVKVGEAELSMSGTTAAFSIQPEAIVLAYFLNNKFSFNFARPAGQQPAKK